MGYTGTNESSVLIKNITANNLNFKTENLPVNLNVDVEQQTKTIVEQLIERINNLESQQKIQFPSGTIMPYGGNSEIVTFDEGGGASVTPVEPPYGFLFCFGQLVEKEQYSDLYAVIGDNWKQSSDGDLGTQFRVPDLRSMFLRGYTPYEDSPIGQWDEFKTVGGYQRDVAPNIHGQARGFIYNPSDYWHNFSLSFKDGVGLHIPNNAGGQYYGNMTLIFNAKQSYDGYQDDVYEIRPHNMRVNYIIKT